MRLNVLKAAVYAVVMAALIFPARYAFPADAVPAAAKPAAEEWMGVYMGGKKAGYASTVVRETPGGFEVSEELHAVLSVLGFQQEISMTTASSLTSSLELRDLRFLMDAGVARTAVSGTMQDKTLSIEIAGSGGGVQKERIDFPESPFVSSSVGLFISRQDLKPGSRFSLPFFDPATLSRENLNIEVEAAEEMKLGGKTVPLYRIREEYAGVETRTWFSREAGTVKGEGPMGFTFVRETKEQAMRAPDGGYQPGDIIAMASIPADADIAAPEKVVYMKARLTGGDLGGLDINGGRQALLKDIVEVSREKIDNMPTALIPVKDPAMAAYLRPETYVQSDDPAIKRKAEEVAGGEKDAIAAAKKLAEWVHVSVKKKPSAGIPNASEVLQELSGDCNEHTMLFTALARAAGIPAKMDAGVVLIGGRFYYHAWPEIWAGKWIAIDPTFGQFPADAAHIRLEEGGLDRQVKIMKLMGKMKVEILEYAAE